jgi:hypothetical protein
MPSDASKADLAERPPRGEEPMYELIELFFFAYRDFVADADRLLEALNRVLRELVDKNFIEIRAGALDRRRRQLYATLDGERLALKLAQVQTRRFALALEQLGDWGPQTAKSFLSAMIDPQEPSSHSTARQEAARRAGRTQ